MKVLQYDPAAPIPAGRIVQIITHRPGENYDPLLIALDDTGAIWYVDSTGGEWKRIETPGEQTSRKVAEAAAVAQGAASAPAA